MSHKKPKIFYVYTSAWYQGSNQDAYDRSLRERFIVDYTRSIGYDSKLLMLTYGAEIEVMPDSTGGVFFPVDNPSCYNPGNHTSKAMLTYIEAEKPDFIIFKGMGNLLSRWLVAESRLIFRFGFIVGGKTHDFIFRFSDYVLAEHNKQIESFFMKHYKHESADILPKFLNPDDFISNSEQKKEFDIISVGRLSSHKNYKALIPFFEKYRIALIGDGPCFDELKLIADKYPKNVYMPGSLPHNEVLKYIRRSRLLVHPCSWEKGLEGFPRVLAESFSCGVPVVVLRKTIPSGFEHGVHGLMVDENEFETSVHSLLNDHKLLERMGRDAYLFAKENYTERAVADVINQMYDRVFDRSSNNRSFINTIILKKQIEIFQIFHKSKSGIRDILSKVKMKLLKLFNFQ